MASATHLSVVRLPSLLDWRVPCRYGRHQAGANRSEVWMTPARDLTRLDPRSAQPRSSRVKKVSKPLTSSVIFHHRFGGAHIGLSPAMHVPSISLDLRLLRTWPIDRSAAN